MKPVDTKINFCCRIIFLCAVLVNLGQAAEPSYDDRALSEWLLLNSSPSFAQQYLPNGSPSPAEAIRKIGTNGVPTMVGILSARSSNIKSELRRLKSPLVKNVFSSGAENPDDFRKMAVDGFGVLGTNAACAVPQLSHLFYKYDQETFFQTAQAMAKVGPAGFAVLTNALNSPDPGVRNNVIWALGQCGGADDRMLTGILVKSLQDPSPENRGNAAIALSGKDPRIAVPALMTLLDDKEYYPLRNAAMILGYYGPAAKAAAPKLFCIFTNILAGTNEFMIQNMSVCAFDNLKKIDPPTASKAAIYLIDGGPLGPPGVLWTETPLPNGNELIAGGLYPNPHSYRGVTLARAQLLDPVTGRRTETGSMQVERNGHRAILLRNGKVFVVGGEDDKGRDLTSAELYDPATGKWTLAGSMHSTHQHINPVLQSDGKVRIDDELYDPNAGKWSLVESK